MVLDTKTFEKDHVFYQGFSGKYDNRVLKSHQYFYVANKKSTANHYMYKNIMNTRRPPYVCTYKLTRPLKLLKMNSKTITFLLNNILDKDGKGYKAIKFAFGKASKNNKVALLRNIVKSNVFNHYKNSVIANNRISFRESNWEACSYLCKFLSQNGIDGYYYPGSPTFHEEIMICDASNKLLHVSCKTFINKSPVLLVNKHVTFVKNVLNNPTLENLTYLESNVPVGRNVYRTIDTLKKKLYKQKIHNQTSINNLDALIYTKAGRLKRNFVNLENDILKKKKLLQLPNNIKIVLNKIVR